MFLLTGGLPQSAPQSEKKYVFLVQIKLFPLVRYALVCKGKSYGSWLIQKYNFRIVMLTENAKNNTPQVPGDTTAAIKVLKRPSI